MSGWYFVYLLMSAINGAMLVCHDFMLWDWQFWVWAFIPVISHIAGREVERGK